MLLCYASLVSPKHHVSFDFRKRDSLCQLLQERSSYGTTSQPVSRQSVILVVVVKGSWWWTIVVHGGKNSVVIHFIQQSPMRAEMSSSSSSDGNPHLFLTCLIPVSC